MADEELWIGLVGLKPLAKPHDMIDNAAGAFTNFIAWADSKEAFLLRVEQAAKHYGFFVAELEGVEPVSQRLRERCPDEEIMDLISQAELDRNAVLYATFHLYPHEDA